ncbi:TonB-dependent receptor [Sphingomonas sp. AP4-R1]|uniref:TonB-dependent receptor n=1 Tax=Sphingomonas sp. AP4-R1 TaxID=2735134 RepID=UPI00149398F2|nr:TonB-dependent receptor [Sphingomonas sp. AP4-R1]QJU58174.1 TonB-dependent receptor [Sphingomonas sp. AP4-R1]
MTHVHYKGKSCIVNFALASTILATSALAQSPPAIPAPEKGSAASGSQLDEIVVTAQKRRQSLQDVGIAVSAVLQSQLNAVQVTSDATALARVVPSLQVTQQNPSRTVFNIRGVSQNDFADIQEGPIAFYNDEVYIAFLGAISGQTFDLERVEVLRGPQGTLFGRNATGGLVQAVTRKPTAKFEGFGKVTVGSYDQITTEAAIGGPIGERVRFRVSGTTDHSNGYYHNLIDRDLDGPTSRFYAARGQLDFDIGSSDLLRLKLEYMRNDDERTNGQNASPATQNADGIGVPIGPNENPFGTCAGCNAAGFRWSGNPYTNSSNFAGRFSRTFWNGMARYEHDFGWSKLVSITDYQDIDKKFSQDYDASPRQLLATQVNVRWRQISQELRLSGTVDKLTWLVGGYGMQIKANAPVPLIDLDPLLAEFYAGVPVGTFASSGAYHARQRTRSVAAFSQLEYRFDPVFSLIGGLRYNSDWKRFSYIHTSFGATSYDFAQRRPDLASRRFETWSGKLQLNAQPSRSVLLYAGVNRGTKSGGYNAPFAVPSAATVAPGALPATLAAFDNRIPFGNEVLTSYEGGAKLTLFDNRATFNTAVFHYRYKGYQAFQSTGGNQFIVNLPARVTGLEAELTARPLPWLRVTAFATHLFDATILNLQLPGGRITDRDLPNAPAWSYGGSVATDFNLGNVGSMTISTNWKHNSSQYLSTFNAPVDHEPAYTIGDVAVSIKPDNVPIEATFFINNVSNVTYRTFGLDNSFVTAVENVYVRPRWYGGSLTYRFQ